MDWPVNRNRGPAGQKKIVSHTPATHSLRTAAISPWSPRTQTSIRGSLFNDSDWRLKSLGLKCGTIAEILLYLFPETISVKMKNFIFHAQKLNDNHRNAPVGNRRSICKWLPGFGTGDAGNGGRPERKEAIAGTRPASESYRFLIINDGCRTTDRKPKYNRPIYLPIRCK